MRVRNASQTSPVTPFAPAAERRSRTESADAIDEVGVSDAARELSHALRAVEASPGERALRVQALKAAVQNGSYELDAEAVAKKLLERGFEL